METIRLTVLAMALLGSAGCGMAIGSHTMWDTANLVPPSPMKSVAEVQVFNSEARPKLSCVPTAALVANGNGYATEKDLMDALRLETFRVRANILFVSGEIGTTPGMAVSTYGGGIALSSQSNLPYMQGLACRTGQIWHGLRFHSGHNWVVRYVYDDSPGQKAGIKEGDEVVTVEGAFVGDDANAWTRHVSAGKPLTDVRIGVVRAGVKQSVVMRLERYAGDGPIAKKGESHEQILPLP